MSITKLKKIRTQLLFIALSLVALASYYIVLPYNNDAKIYFFDIGQGDATLITMPDDIQVLIDGGPDTTILSKLTEVLPPFDRTIEYVILSHPHSDHLAGVVEVLKRYDVGLVLTNGIRRDELSLFDTFESIIAEKQINTHIIDKPLIIDFNENASMEFYYPDIPADGKNGDINATSLVHRFTYGKIHTLFTGDIPKDVEEYLIAKEVDILADILKVAHQGSRSSSDEKFIMNVSPQYSIISVGKNNQYGHPHIRTLRTLESYGGTVFRTDVNGDISATTDGISLFFNTKK